MSSSQSTPLKPLNGNALASNSGNTEMLLRFICPEQWWIYMLLSSKGQSLTLRSCAEKELEWTRCPVKRGNCALGNPLEYGFTYTVYRSEHGFSFYVYYDIPHRSCKIKWSFYSQHRWKKKALESTFYLLFPSVISRGLRVTDVDTLNQPSYMKWILRQVAVWC